MDVKTQIKDYIVDNFLFGDGEVLKDDDMSLLDEGVIDSVGVMELVAFLEGDLGIKVGDEELVPENLDSLNNLAAFVGRKKQVA